MYNRQPIKSFVKVAELRQQINSSGPVNYSDFKSPGIELEICCIGNSIFKILPPDWGADWKYQYDQ